MSAHFKNPEWLRRLPHYVYLHDLYQNRRVLELSCRAGAGAEFLASHGAAHVAGVDTQAPLIEDAIQKYSLPNLAFYCRDYAQLGFADHEFDCVFVPQEVDFLRRDDWLAEVRRVLRVDGVLILKAPSSDGRSRRGRGVSFHEFAERLEPSFGKVRMVALSPFVGLSLVEYGEDGSDPDPDFDLDNSLSELGQGVDVLDYVALCGGDGARLRGYRLVQLPSAEGVDMLVPALDCLTARRLTEIEERSPISDDGRLAQAVLAQRRAERDNVRLQRALEAAERELGNAVASAGGELKRVQEEKNVLRKRVAELEGRLARQRRDSDPLGHGTPVPGLAASPKTPAAPDLDHRLRGLERKISEADHLIDGFAEELRAAREHAEQAKSEVAISEWAARREEELRDLAAELGLRDAEIMILNAGISSLTRRIHEAQALLEEARVAMSGAPAPILETLSDLSARLRTIGS
jgi:SAM-dependent methyltransferase